MATKVKGGAIKEGSIPLSALSKEIKDKIENAGGGADWNAQKGEAGYIENRPFERKNIEPFIYDDEVVYEDFSDIDIYIQCYDSIYSFPVGYNDDGLFIENEKEIYIPENSVSIKVRRYEYEMRIQSLNSELDVNDIPSLITVFYVDRKLNQSDIDNTVLKITPQSFSDTDKNQALTNLGIDYILKPSEIPQKPIVVLPPYVGEDYQYLNIPWNEIGFTEKHLGLLLKGISLGLITKDNIHEYFYPVDYIADYRVSGYEFNNNYIKFHVYDESQELGGDFVIRFDSKTIDMPLWE